MWSLFKKAKNDFPAFIQDYLALDFSIKSSTLIEDGGFVILDCESTGIDKHAEIITIGAVLLKNNTIELNHLLDIRRTLSESGSEAVIHGELSGDGYAAEEEQQATVINFLSNHIIVGHHISFDVKLINRWIQLTQPGFKIKNKVIDTLEVVRRLNPQRLERKVAGHDNLQLDALCEEFGIAVENRHTALGDAYMTAQLFHRLAGKLQKRGVTKLRQIAN